MPSAPNMLTNRGGDTVDPAGGVTSDVVDQLLEIEADLVVTITMPLDRRRPGNHEDRIRLRNLLAQATQVVRDRWPAKKANSVLNRLEAAASRIDLAAGGHGAVLIATSEDADAHLSQFPLREAVSVGTTPATRFLLQGLRRSPRYRVLVLSDRGTRLFEAVRDQLVEVTEHGFPLRARIVPRDRRAVAGRFALAPGRDDKELRRNFYRDVDRALTDASRGTDAPLVIVGVRSSTALFEEVSHNAHRVIGRIDGAYDHATARDLGVMAWPILRERLRVRRRTVVQELQRSLAAGKAVTGIDEVWQLAREGRGRLLIVEEDYEAEPSTEIDGRLVPETSGAVMSDPVDEVIEHVVRAGGAVEFVGSGALDEFGHIGLVLR